MNAADTHNLIERAAHLARLGEERPMSTRKKWRIKLYPMFEYYPKTSKRAAYEEVEEWRRGYANGVLAVHEVDVEVDECDGSGWALYERIIFPTREAKP